MDWFPDRFATDRPSSNRCNPAIEKGFLINSITFAILATTWLAPSVIQRNEEMKK